MNISNTPIIFNDIDLEKSFNEFPIELQNNEFFIFHYFSSKKASLEEIKKIPAHLLENQFFVAPCLKMNPDICISLINSPHIDLYHQVIEMDYTNHVLKYANATQLSNYDFCFNKVKKQYANYQYISDNYKRDNAICKAALDINPEMIKYFPFKDTDSDAFVSTLLKTYHNIYQYLPIRYKSSFSICYLAILKDHNNLKHFPKMIKEDKSFILSIIDMLAIKNSFSIPQIIPFLPISYYDDDFCNKYSKEITKSYILLPAGIRNLENVILSAFSNIKMNSYEHLAIIKAIPNKELKKQFDIFIKDKKTKREGYHEKYIPLLKSYLLNKKLSNNLSKENTTTIKKIKI